MATIGRPKRQLTEVDLGIADRLRAATIAHRDAQEVARVAAGVWREAVVDAVDAGMQQQDVADLARVSRARVHHVIVREYAVL